MTEGPDIDPTMDAAWTNQLDITADEQPLKVDDALILTGFAFGHTVCMDEDGVRPLIVATVEGVDASGMREVRETFVYPPAALRVMAHALEDVLARSGMETLREILTAL